MKYKIYTQIYTAKRQKYLYREKYLSIINTSKIDADYIVYRDYAITSSYGNSNKSKSN